MKKTEKIRYEIDPHNRLVYEKTGRKSDVHQFRTVVDGKFVIDKDNQLSYHLKKSQVSDTPQQVKLKGKWALDDEHNLVLTLDKWGNQIAGNKLTIKSELIDAGANKLSFTLATKDSSGKTQLYILQLDGVWQADKNNRLTFNIKKEQDTTDKLILEGAWEVNKQNEIIYTYTKASLKSGEKITKTITLKGYWDITEKCRISYVLDKKMNSQFEFEVSLGKPNKKRLEYEVGIGVRPVKRTISFFGKWKVSKKLGLLFMLPYEKGKLHSIIFGASVKLGKNYDLEFKLKNQLGQDLGIDIKLSRNIFDNQGEAFIRALRSRKEVSIVAGVGFRW